MLSVFLRLGGSINFFRGSTPLNPRARACLMTKVWRHIQETKVYPPEVKKNPKKNFGVQYFLLTNTFQVAS